MASSGDLLADRRYGWAEGAMEEGDFAAAADLAQQTVEIAGDFAAGWFLLGKAQHGLSNSAAAREAFARALALDEEDRLGAGVWLAQLGAREAENAMSAAYVRGLFDEYAVRFDRHLVKSLKYRAPDLLHDAVRRACSRRLRPFHFADAIDLGCGTGLAGEAFRSACGTLVGVDLSSAMVKRAAAKRVYDDLAVGDLAGWLEPRGDETADLALAADVFVYIADLAPIVAAVGRVLRPDGLFGFTVQAHSGAGIALGEDARYAHSEGYLRDCATRAGLAVVLLEAASTRQDRGIDVPGWLIVLARVSNRSAAPPK
jgi:predicted TPR repeat methyltransferase